MDPTTAPPTNGLVRAVHSLASRALPAGLATGAAVAAVHAINALLDRPFSDLDAEREANLITWIGIVATFTGAAAAALHAQLLPSRRVMMRLLAAALVFLSLDDAIEIHERLGDKADRLLPESLDAFTSALQLLLISPALLVALGGLLLVARDTFPEARRTLVGGVACLIAATGIELVLGLGTNALEDHGILWPDVLRNGLEEGAQLAGWIAIAGGLTATTSAALISAARERDPRR